MGCMYPSGTLREQVLPPAPECESSAAASIPGFQPVDTSTLREASYESRLSPQNAIVVPRLASESASLKTTGSTPSDRS